MTTDVIRAAGGVVWRVRPDAEEGAEEGAAGDEGSSDVEILLVYRPRYGDWSLPKGKLESGEKHKAAALREVREETGLACHLGDRLTRISYDTPLGPKSVKWWAMEPVDPRGDLEPENPDEVSEAQWLAFPEAWSRLTHGTERTVLAVFGRDVLGLDVPMLDGLA